jgi:hypothetical protein
MKFTYILFTLASIVIANPHKESQAERRREHANQVHYKHHEEGDYGHEANDQGKEEHVKVYKRAIPTATKSKKYRPRKPKQHITRAHAALA